MVKNNIKKSELITASLGNTLEWLDFGLFLFMAPLIGAQFFPHQTSSLSTLDALVVFAAGFICRPLGGVLFGHFGDTIGRAKTLRITILIITLSTFLVGIMPSYHAIGIMAPILFTLLRLLQGISIGGEYSGVMIFLAESAPAHQRGFITSFAATGANFGFLIATLAFMSLNLIYTPEAISHWAWRIPFILAGLPGTIILYYRFKISETKVYNRLQSHHQLSTQPFLTVIRKAPRQLLKIIGLTCMSSTFYYVFFGYMPNYLNHYVGFSLNTALMIQTGMLITMLFLVPVAGLCGDYFSRKTMLIITAVSIMVMSIPCFVLLQLKDSLPIVLALSIATLISCMDQGNSLTAVVENCPENVRYSGIAFSYNLGMALFGGTAPIIVTLLTEHISSIAPAYYLIFMACISLIASFTLLNGNQYQSSVQSATSSE